VEILLQFLALFLEHSAVDFLLLLCHIDYLTFCGYYNIEKGFCQPPCSTSSQ
jgi:hypothetical protein